MKLNSGLKLDTSQARDTSIKIDILLEALLQLEQIRETVKFSRLFIFDRMAAVMAERQDPFRVESDSTQNELSLSYSI